MSERSTVDQLGKAGSISRDSRQKDRLRCGHSIALIITIVRGTRHLYGEKDKKVGSIGLGSRGMDV